MISIRIPFGDDFMRSFRQTTFRAGHGGRETLRHTPFIQWVNRPAHKSAKSKPTPYLSGDTPSQVQTTKWSGPSDNAGVLHWTIPHRVQAVRASPIRIRIRDSGLTGSEGLLSVGEIDHPTMCHLLKGDMTAGSQNGRTDLSSAWTARLSQPHILPHAGHSQHTVNKKNYLHGKWKGRIISKNRTFKSRVFSRSKILGKCNDLSSWHSFQWFIVQNITRFPLTTTEKNSKQNISINMKQNISAQILFFHRWDRDQQTEYLFRFG